MKNEFQFFIVRNALQSVFFSDFVIYMFVCPSVVCILLLLLLSSFLNRLCGWHARTSCLRKYFVDRPILKIAQTTCLSYSHYRYGRKMMEMWRNVWLLVKEQSTNEVRTHAQMMMREREYLSRVRDYFTNLPVLPEWKQKDHWPIPSDARGKKMVDVC